MMPKDLNSCSLKITPSTIGHVNNYMVCKRQQLKKEHSWWVTFPWLACLLLMYIFIVLNALRLYLMVSVEHELLDKISYQNASLLEQVSRSMKITHNHTTKERLSIKNTLYWKTTTQVVSSVTCKVMLFKLLGCIF